MSKTDELACTYAALLLHDDDQEITADKISAVLNAANVKVQSFYPTLFAKYLATNNLTGLLSNVSAGGGGAPAAAAAAPVEEKKAAPAEDKKKKEVVEEEEEGDMGFGLFD
eukprot:NODE_11735_length_435_cov_277.926282_g11079_i0.p2 GENE.NODE_11735_length_435_cov_277.926282_g11079_i0~~NODE_11735_length_435_cov_277.926282_g11079_i0.p2  ORF type:complete len:111 (-),score=39.92 NODE_11735_length_435_cov_277.926282_g11079_i0:56-388(-)